MQIYVSETYANFQAAIVFKSSSRNEMNVYIVIADSAELATRLAHNVMLCIEMNIILLMSDLMAAYVSCLLY
jgi:hypothetical protein